MGEELGALGKLGVPFLPATGVSMMKWTKGGSMEYFESLTFPSAEMTDVLETLGETRSILCSLFVSSLETPTAFRVHVLISL